MSTPARNRVPSACIWVSRASRCFFSILKSGMPYRSSPPMRSSRSKTATVWPARVSCWAAASPAGPDPTIATVLPVSRSGGCGCTQLFDQAWSMIETSTCLMVTAGWLMLSTQRALARRRAEPAGELGEVVGGVQPLDRLRALAAPHQVVPLRDEVAQRAALVAERDAAVHAPAGLPAQLGRILRLVHLAPVHEPQGDRAPLGQLALLGLEESLRIGHGQPPVTSRMRLQTTSPSGSSPSSTASCLVSSTAA